MKKLIFGAVLLIVSLACCNDPDDMADNHDVQFSVDTLKARVEGGSYSINIQSNVKWEVCGHEGNILSVSPTSGEGDGILTVELDENPGYEELLSIIVIRMNESDRLVNQTFIARVVQAPIALTREEVDISCCNGSVNINVNSHTAWEVVGLPEGVRVVPESGDKDTEAKVYYRENLSDQTRDLEVVFSTETDTKAYFMLRLKQPEFSEKTTLVYGEETYNIHYMKDGRWWFADNLRYIPEGKSKPTGQEGAGAGIWNPVNGTPNPAVFFTAEDDIKKYGYLYDFGTAIGIPMNEVNKNDFNQYARTRGICPEGWHIPDNEEGAAFFDIEKGTNSYILLTDMVSAGCMPGNFGAVTGTTGAVSRVGGIHLSTMAGTGATVMNRIFMMNNTNSRITMAQLASANGMHVRCINDQFTEDE